MINGPRASLISEGHIGGGFIVNTERNGKCVQLRYCGLLDTMRAVCFPDYDYKKAKAAADLPAVLKSKTGLSRPWHGIQRGRLLHHQVRAYVNAGGERAVRGMFGGGKKDFSLAREFLDSLGHFNLTPLRAEFADFYEYIALASSVDLLCLHTSEKTGEDSLSLVEIKTGYENTFLDSTGPLRAPESLRAKYNNSPLTQAFLQLAFYRQMIRHHYPSIPIGPCYVIQVRSSDTVYHKLPLDIISASSDLLTCISEARLRELSSR